MMTLRQWGGDSPLAEFKLERYFARYEFTVPHQLASSDAESFSVGELLALESGAEHRFHQLALGYTESLGGRPLREAIARLYQCCSTESILAYAGAQEAIFTYMLSALRPGDHVIVQYPCYQSLVEVARWLGCQVTLWTMEERDGLWHLPMEQLVSSIKGNTRAVIINTPHNPTGYCWSRTQLDQLIRLAREHDLLILADEVYRYSEYVEATRLPWVCDLYEQALSIGVMSKSFGLAGLRVGWAASQDRSLLADMAACKDYTSICNSAPSEFLATIALKHRQVLLERNLSIIEKNLRLADVFFAEFTDLFVWRPPLAGTIAFPRLRGGQADLFCQQLRERAGVLLLPASCYDFGQHHFRIGFGRKDFGVGLEKWAEYCRTLPLMVE